MAAQAGALPRVADGKPDFEVTVEDPKVFSRPWKMRMPLYRRLEPNVQILDYECGAFDELGSEERGVAF